MPKLTSLALGSLLALSAVVGAEPQPRMRDALVQLQTAEQSLLQATHDKGGHRKKALELTQAAIQEVKIGIRVDNQN